MKKINMKSFIIVFSIFWMLFLLIPFLNSFILSFQSCRGTVCEFSGLANYKRLLTDEVFLKVTKNTFTYLIFQVPLMILLSIVFANLLSNSSLKLRGFFRTAFFLPVVTSLVGYALVFKLMFASDGIINHILISVGALQNGIEWVADPFWGKVLIIISITWRWTGYNMIFFLAAIQNIPKEIYEAAKIDGAGTIQTFFKVTVPQLKPVILFTTIMSTIGTLQLFDEVVNITQGGPGYETMTISQYIYNLSFTGTPNFGYAATVSYFIVLMVVILAIIQKKVVGE